jgi:hypothetical protein
MKWSKVFTGVVIVGVLYMMYRQHKETKQKPKCQEQSTQTDNIDTIIEETPSQLDLACLDPDSPQELYKTPDSLHEDDDDQKIFEDDDKKIFEEIELVNECRNDDDNKNTEFDVVNGNNLSILSLAELKEVAKAQGIKGFSRMKKAELIQKLSVI